MSKDQSKSPSEADAELEQEIRKGRKFSLAEAIGRMAGPGAMKGVSPITRKQQSEVEIEEYLKRHLGDATDILTGILVRSIKGSDILVKNYDKPLCALGDGIRRVLGSDYLLKELVRQADVEWGRANDQRPYFEQEGCPPDPDDPFTIESVRSSLSHLLEKLTAEKPRD